MKIINTPLADCVLIKSQRHCDNRGFFQELFRENLLAHWPEAKVLVQDNWSRSVYGVLRGMHFQRNQSQAKLLTVLRGKIFDVVVDIRKDSATFGQWHGEVLSEDEPTQLWIPQGFAHGFLVMSQQADVLYKTSTYYNREDEVSFAWNDAQLAIKWPFEPTFLSDKDNNAPLFSTTVQC